MFILCEIFLGKGFKACDIYVYIYVFTYMHVYVYVYLHVHTIEKP